MLPGGGIGPELMQHVREVFGKIGVPVDFEIIDINPTSEGNDDLDYAITSIRRNGVAIKGIVLYKVGIDFTRISSKIFFFQTQHRKY